MYGEPVTPEHALLNAAQDAFLLSDWEIGRADVADPDTDERQPVVIFQMTGRRINTVDVDFTTWLLGPADSIVIGKALVEWGRLSDGTHDHPHRPKRRWRWGLRGWVGAIAIALAGACAAPAHVADAETGSRSAAVGSLGPALPHHNLTPGVYDANVDQSNIAATICKGGYSASIRPPESFTTKLRNKQVPIYGYADKKVTDYVEDHLIPLSLAGAATDTGNLWPEPKSSSQTKDGLENYLLFRVCRAHVRLPLAVARHDIAANWYAAWIKYGKPMYVNHTPYFTGGNLS